MSQKIDMSSVDVDQLMVKWDEALALRRARTTLKPIKIFIKKRIVDPLLFVFVSAAILILPQSLISLLSRKRIVSRVQRVTIRAFDVLIASIGLLLSSPFWLAIPVLIKLDSRGPVFYKQMRTGIDRRKGDRRHVALGIGTERRKGDRRQIDLHGKPFHIIKFRTMTFDAEKKSGAVWATQDDPRITRIGAWLRKYHVDEIPQLLNVLRGDMSMIGPRPERPIIINDLKRELPEYQRRLVVKPGVTGPAQIFLGYDRCLADIERKIQFDSLYINHQSLRFYSLLLTLTAIKIVSGLVVKQQSLFNLNMTLDKDQKSEEVTYSH